MAHVKHNSGNNEWYTPPIFIEAARTVLGEIDLDPASSEKANKNVKAKVFYTKEDDGLSLPWNGNIWLNPPYERGLVNKFIEKLYEEIDKGGVGGVIVLTNNATETQWWQKLVSGAHSICFPKGRIQFLGEDGEVKNSPVQGQSFVLISKEKLHQIRFINEFSKFGRVLRV